MILLHYHDLLRDLPGATLRLARRLGIDRDQATLESLSEAATFDRMRAAGDRLAPDPHGVLKSRAAALHGPVRLVPGLLPATLISGPARCEKQEAPGAVTRGNCLWG